MHQLYRKEEGYEGRKRREYVDFFLFWCKGVLGVERLHKGDLD